jgi:hypothetical protein
MTFTALAEATDCDEKSDARFRCTADALGRCASLGGDQFDRMAAGMTIMEEADRVCARVK